MAIPIPSPLIDFILLGPADDRRQLQDSPILGDVWVEFGRNPATAVDLLISPYRTHHAGTVAAAIQDGLGGSEDRANIAYLQGLVVARLSFAEVLGVVLPKTKWWIDKWIEDSAPKAQRKRKADNQKGNQPKSGAAAEPRHEARAYYTQTKIVLDSVIQSARAWHSKTGDAPTRELTPLDRFFALAGLILWAGVHDRPTAGNSPGSSDDEISYILANISVEKILGLLAELLNKMLADPQREPLVWQVSLNRTATPALTKSIPAVKADAAKTLFKVNCGEIAWAVIDSGIDGSHPAFETEDGTRTRVKRSFDFKNFRKIVSLSNSSKGMREENIKVLMKDKDLLVDPPSDPDAALKKLAEDARN